MTSDGGGGGTDGAAAGDMAMMMLPPPVGCPALPAPAGTVVMVTPADVAALPGMLLGAAAGTTFLLADGTYALSGSLRLTKPGMALRSAANDKGKVILDAGYTVKEAVVLTASNTTVAHLTIRRAEDHPIHAQTAGGDVTGIVIYGVHIEDGGEQFIKINSGDGNHYVDDGRIECSSFRLTPAGRPNVEPNPGGCYTGGVDAHGARGWIVRHNDFRDLHCDNGSLAEHAIHFWTGSRDTLVENNLIVDCARGIGFGLGDGGGRTYDPDPFPGVQPIGHFGGIIRNNVIWATTRWFDTGIELNQARGAQVLHNTVVSQTPPNGVFYSSIDYRFANTDVELRNNLTTRITQRDGGQAMRSHNLESTPLSHFADPAAFDFHLASGATTAIDQGTAHPNAGHDLDGEPHDKGAPDIGADER
jgi:hypothetical protein